MQGSIYRSYFVCEHVVSDKRRTRPLFRVDVRMSEACMNKVSYSGGGVIKRLQCLYESGPEFWKRKQIKNINC